MVSRNASGADSLTTKTALGLSNQTVAKSVRLKSVMVCVRDVVKRKAETMQVRRQKASTMSIIASDPFSSVLIFHGCNSIRIS